MKKRNIAIGASLLAASSLISRLLGVARDSVFAGLFGADSSNPAMDINTYFAAFKIPDLIYTLLIFGAMSAAFLPIYSRLKSSSQEKADDFANQIITGMLIISTIFSILSYILAPWIIPFLVPGFTAEALEMSIELTRIMLLSPILFGLSSIFQGIENAHKRYLGIALAPIVYNLSIILSALLFANKMGVKALAWGVVAGATLHFLVQLPGAIKCGFRFKRVKQIINKESIEFIKLAIPRILGLGLTQIAVLVETLIASLLAGGSLAILTYANNLQSLAYGVVGISVSIAAFAHLAEEGQEKDKSKFIQTIKRSTEGILFWVIPAIAGLFVLNQEIVEWILQRGAFTQEAANMTALTFSIFIWSALAQSLTPLYTRAFYALEDTKTPLSLVSITTVLSLSTSLVLTQIFKFEVWALGVSAIISQNLYLLLMIVFLKRKIKAGNIFPHKALLQNMFIAAIMSFGVMGLKQLNIEILLLEIITLSIAGGIIYIGLHKLNRTSLI